MKSWLFLAIALSLTLAAHAQSNEVAAEASGVIVADATDPGFGGGFQLNYAHRLFGVPGVGFYAEVPFVAGLNNTQVLITQIQRLDYKSYFVTPGVRVKFVPAFPISPYLAAGVGWAHFTSKRSSATDDEFAADWAAGLDTKLAPFIGLRFEVRDFYTDLPHLVPLTGLSFGKQNNVVVSTGVVLRF